MPSRALAYPFAQGYCVAPSSLSKCQSTERSTPATYLPDAGERHHLQTMHQSDQGPLFTPRVDEAARTISVPLGSEAAPASPIRVPPCGGEQLSPSDAAIARQARQACYEFSHGDEDLEIMYELHSDMGITLRHPQKAALAAPPPPSAGRRWLKRRAEEAPEGDMVDSSTSVPLGGYDWAPTGLGEGQAPIFWHGDGRFASLYGDASGGDAVQTLELLGARLHKDARRQLELTESCVWSGPGGAVS